MIKSELLYLHHVIDAITRIELFSDGYALDDITLDRMRYDAILRNLQTMAESTQKLNNQTKDKYPHIPWHDISGFRNILVHDYLEGIDSEIIFSIIRKELPVLKAAILQEIKLIMVNAL